MTDIFIGLDDDPRCTIYPLRSVEGWIKLGNVSPSYGYFDGTDDKYSLLADMDQSVFKATLLNPSREFTFYGYYNLCYYQRKSKFSAMVLELGAINVVSPDRVGIWCMKLNVTSGVNSDPPKPEYRREQRFVCLVLSGPGASFVRAFRGAGGAVTMFTDGEVEYHVTSMYADQVEITVPDSLKFFFFNSYMKEPNKYDYFNLDFYKSFTYAMWSLRTHGPQVADLCNSLSDYHIVAPGDGLGLAASSAKYGTMGDPVINTWTHPKVLRESFSETLARANLECEGRPKVLVLSYVWHVLSDTERVKASNERVIVIDSVSPSSPLFPVWYLIGPNVWSKLPEQVSCDSPGERSIDEVVPYSENLVRFNPKTSFGAFGSWPQAFDLFGTKAGSAHTRVSTILQMAKEVQSQQFFIQTGCLFKPMRISLSSTMTLLPRQVYFFRLGTSYDRHVRRFPHESHDGYLYFWIHSMGDYSYSEGTVTFVVHCSSSHLPTLDLQKSASGQAFFIIEDGPPAKFSLSTASLEFVEDRYGQTERLHLESIAFRISATIHETGSYKVVESGRSIAQDSAMRSRCLNALQSYELDSDSFGAYIVTLGTSRHSFKSHTEMRNYLVNLFRRRELHYLTWFQALMLGLPMDAAPSDVLIWRGVLFQFSPGFQFIC